MKSLKKLFPRVLYELRIWDAILPIISRENCQKSAWANQSWFVFRFPSYTRHNMSYYLMRFILFWQLLENDTYAKLKVKFCSAFWRYITEKLVNYPSKTPFYSWFVFFSVVQLSDEPSSIRCQYCLPYIPQRFGAFFDTLSVVSCSNSKYSTFKGVWWFRSLYKETALAVDMSFALVDLDITDIYVFRHTLKSILCPGHYIECQLIVSIDV